MGIDKEFLASLKIEPLDSDRHERAAFSCGEPRIDNYLKNSAGNHARQDFVKVYVAVRKDSATVLGYYAIGPHAIDVSALSPEMAKKMPRWPSVSAFYLSMVGVDVTCQGKGLGSLLVGDAFKRCAMVADEVGGCFIVLDALSDDAARLYRRLGFIDLPSHEHRMLIGMKKVRASLPKAK
jgi:ribosomal protein S18 acetylase RimI-like enzyme